MSNVKDGIGELIKLLVLALISMFIGFVIGLNQLRSDAVKAGSAEWTINPKTGEKNFTWITHPEKSE